MEGNWNPLLLFCNGCIMPRLIICFPKILQFSAEESINSPLRIRAFKILRGHTAAVESVATQASGDMVQLISFFISLLE